MAYQVVGDGPPDLVLVPGFVSHVEAAWGWPYLARFDHRLASFSRLIIFDKRGTGLSDPLKHPPTMKERMDDIRDDHGRRRGGTGSAPRRLGGRSSRDAVHFQTSRSRDLADPLRLLRQDAEIGRIPLGGE